MDASQGNVTYQHDLSIYPLMPAPDSAIGAYKKADIDSGGKTLDTPFAGA